MTRQLYNILFLLFIIFSNNFIKAQKSIRLNCNGNKQFSLTQYQKWIDQPSQKISDSTIISFVQKRISTNLNNNGFFRHDIISASLDSSTTTAYFVSLNIKEGDQSIVDSVLIDNQSKSDSLIFSEFFENLIDAPFNNKFLEDRIGNALNYYENNGYPFAKIIVQSVLLNDNGKVTVRLNINHNTFSTIDKIEIDGNNKTNSSVIINAIRLEKGEPYSQKKIDNIPVLLSKLRFFEKINSPNYLVNSKGEGILQIAITEKNTNSFDGIIGYVPAGDNNKNGYLTGFVNISLRNLFGTGRSSAFRWQQESSQTQELELKYMEPWLFNYPFNLTLQFLQRKQDTSYVKRSYSGNLEFLATQNISAAIILESESTIPSINKNENIIVSNANSINTGVQLKLDYRNNIFAPTKGLYFVSTYKYKSKSVSGNSLNDKSNFKYHNYELDFGGYYSFFTNQVIAIGLHAKEIIGDNFELSDYFQFGGANTLRGYRENQFLGNRILWSNLEYRFMLSTQSYIFAFYDLGYFLINANNLTQRLSETKNGYGIGLSLETGLGIMKISYAISEGVSLSNGLIHFGIVNEF